MGPVSRAERAFQLTLFFGLMLALAPQAAALHWAGNGSLEPRTVYPQETVPFTFSMTNSANSILDVYWVRATFCWQQSDRYYEMDYPRSVQPQASSSFTASIQIPAHQGACNVKVKVYAKAKEQDLYAETKEYSFTIQVAQRAPLSVAATANPNSGQAPLLVFLSATANGGTPPFTFAWTLGDGSTLSQQSGSHSYSNQGTYTATVIVVDQLNRQASSSTTIAVTAPPPPPPPPPPPVATPSPSITPSPPPAQAAPPGDGSRTPGPEIALILGTAACIALIIRKR
jgi:chitodextrinase